MPKMNRALKQPKAPKVAAPSPQQPTDRVPRVGGRPEGEKSADLRGPKQSRGSNFRDFPRLVKQMGGSAPIGGPEGPADLDNPRVDRGRRAGPFRDSQGFVDKGALQQYFDKLQHRAARHLEKTHRMAERLGDRLIDEDDDDDAEIEAGGMRIGGRRPRDLDEPRIRRGRNEEDEGQRFDSRPDAAPDAPHYGKQIPFGDDRRELQPDGSYGTPQMSQAKIDAIRHATPGLPNSPEMQQKAEALRAAILNGKLDLVDDLIRLLQGGTS